LNKLIVVLVSVFFLTSCDKDFFQRMCSFAKPVSFSESWNINPDKKNIQQPTSMEILKQSINAYSSLTSYQDKGTVISVFASEHNFTQHLEFHTEFDRDHDKFRFEFRESPGLLVQSYPYVVWKDKEQVKTWWALGNRLETNLPIDLAIAGATGISKGAASLISAVLMRKEGENICGFLIGCPSYRINDIDEDGASYFRVQTIRHQEASGTNENSVSEVTTKETFWIRKDNLLVYRVVEDSVFATFKVHTVIQYLPILNQKIPDSSFEFGH